MINKMLFITLLFTIITIKAMTSSDTVLLEQEETDITNLLMEAIHHGNLSLVKRLVKQHPETSHWLMTNNTQLLHNTLSMADDKTTNKLFFTRYPAQAMVKFLLQYNNDINVKNNEGNTLLEQAIIYKKLSAALFLIEKGANVNSVAKQEQAPLRRAIDINVGRRFTTPVNTVSLIKLLLEKKAQVNVQDDNGYTPLHQAVGASNSLEIVQLLLKYGADVNAKNNNGATPLYLADTVYHNKSMSTLLQHQTKNKQTLDQVTNIGLQTVMATTVLATTKS